MRPAQVRREFKMPPKDKKPSELKMWLITAAIVLGGFCFIWQFSWLVIHFKYGWW